MYISYRNLRFLTHEIIIKTNVFSSIDDLKPIMVILFRPSIIFVLKIKNKIFGFQMLTVRVPDESIPETMLTVSVPDESYSRNNVD